MHLSICILTFLPTFAGSSVWEIQAQHGGVHSREGVQPEKPEDHPSAGSADQRIASVRKVAKEGETDGAPDQESVSAEGVHLQSGRRVSRVSGYFPILMWQHTFETKLRLSLLMIDPLY